MCLDFFIRRTQSDKVFCVLIKLYKSVLDLLVFGSSSFLFFLPSIFIMFLLMKYGFSADPSFISKSSTEK